MRPDSWNLPLFLHILGATVLFGTIATVAIAGFASRSHAGYEGLLARVAARTFLFGVIPSFILMRGAAQWIVGKEFPGNAKTPGWVDVGFVVTEPGAVLLLITGIRIWVSPARPADAGRSDLGGDLRRGPGVAWVAMSGKPSTTTSCGNRSSSQSAVSWISRRPQSQARSLFIFSRSEH